MKYKKIALLGCGAIFFVTTAQLISCGNNKPEPGPTDCSVTIDSSSLVIDKTTATKNTDFAAKISIREGSDNTLTLPYAIKVSINNQEVGNDKYGYTSSGNDAGKFTIPAANVTGNIKITAEADKTTKSVGDYAHIYVANKSVSFTIEDVSAGTYIIRGITESGQPLDAYYIDENGNQIKAETPIITLTPAQNIITFKSSDDKDINNYVTAALIKIVNFNDGGAYFPLNSRYNKKGVAFKYTIPLTSITEGFKIKPIIVDGANYLADSPKGLEKLLSGPIIYSGTNFSPTELEKKNGVDGKYYIAKTNEHITFADNYFLGYFDNIPADTNAGLEISSMINNSEQYNISLGNVSSHKLFIECETEAQTTYYAYNNTDIPLDSVYDGVTFEKFTIRNNHIFTSWQNTKAYLVYKLTAGKTILSYNIYKYDDSIEGGTLNLKDSYKNNTIIFASKNENEPIGRVDLDNKNRYTHIIKVVSASNEQIITASETAVQAYASENSSEGYKYVFAINFHKMYSLVENGKLITYYAPYAIPIGSKDVKDNIIPADDTVGFATLDKVMISFNDKVTSNDSISFISCLPIDVSFAGAPQDDVSYQNQVDTMSYKYAFPGVHYTCKATLAETVKDLNVTVKKGSKTIPNTLTNNVISFLTTNDSGNLIITSQVSDKAAKLKFGYDSQEHPAPTPEKCGFKGGVSQVNISCKETTKVIIEGITVGTKTYVFDDSQTLNIVHFIYVNYSGQHPNTYTPESIDVITENGVKKIQITCKKVNVTDDNKVFHFNNPDNSIDKYWI